MNLPPAFRITVLTAFAAALLIPLAASSGTIFAAQEYVYESIDIDIAVQPDSFMQITETQTLNYSSGTFHYAFRWIPMDRIESINDVNVSEAGQHYAENPEVRYWIEERQENGTAPGGSAYAYTTWLDDGKFWVGWWFPATTARSRTFIINYRVSGGIRIGSAEDEIYWKAVFGDRDVPVNRASVTVKFPAALPQQGLSLKSYGAASSGRLSTPDTVEFTARYIAPDDELEIQIRFPHGMLTAVPPAWQKRLEVKEAWNRDVKPWLNFALLVAAIIVIPLIGFFWLKAALKKSRGPLPSVPDPGILVAPPDNLPPALVKFIANSGSGESALAATIFDLAHRGTIAIQETQEKKWYGTSKDLIFRKKENTERFEFERLLTSVLASDTGESLSVNRSKLAGLAKEFDKEVTAEALRQGLVFEDPARSMRVLAIPGFLLMVAGVMLAIALPALFFDRAEFSFAPFVSLFILGIAAMAISPRLVKYTEKGVRSAAAWKAFGKYLKQSSADYHLASENLNFWDSYLPYAAVFGLMTPWVKRFQEMDAPSPVWFYAAGTGSHGSMSGMSSGTAPLSSISSAFNSMVSTVHGSFSGGGGSEEVAEGEAAEEVVEGAGVARVKE